MTNINIEDVTQRLRAIIKTKNMKFNDVANLLGMKKQSFHAYVDGTRLPTVEALYNLSKLLDVTMEYILTGEELSKTTNTHIMDSSHILLNRIKKLDSKDKERIQYYIDICESTAIHGDTNSIEDKHIYYESDKDLLPILGKVAAGKPIEVIQVPLGYLKTSIPADYALIATGNSMHPLIKDGEYVFVKQISSLDNGEIGIFYIDGETTCKLFYKDEKKVILKSLNPDFSPFEYPLTSLNDFQILGKVLLSDEQKSRYNFFS